MIIVNAPTRTNLQWTINFNLSNYITCKGGKFLKNLIRCDEGLTLETSASESLYGGQFTLSTQWACTQAVGWSKKPEFVMRSPSWIRAAWSGPGWGLTKRARRGRRGEGLRPPCLARFVNPQPGPDLQWAETLSNKIEFLSMLVTFSPFPPKQCWFFYLFDCTDHSAYTTLNWEAGGIRELTLEATQIEQMLKYRKASFPKSVSTTFVAYCLEAIYANFLFRFKL